jgi:hypothetical protein
MKSKVKLVLVAIATFFGLVGLIVFGARIAPLFTLILLGIFSGAVVFMASEDGLSHGAIEYENRFWSLMAFLLACALLLCPDSPFRIEEWKVAVPVIGFFTYFAHLGDRYLRNAVMNRIPVMMRRVRSADFGCLEERTAAHEKVVAIEKLVSTIDNWFISSTFMNMFAIALVLKCERDIIAIFSEVNQRELNFIVQTVSLARVMYKTKDHKLMNIRNRTKLLELLAVKRIKDLTPVSKAFLLHGFQNMKLSAHPQSEYFVKSIIQSTSLHELSELKCLTDTKGDINSMHKLVYSDIRDKKIQTEILEYIKAQAKTQRAHMLIGSKRGRNYEKRSWQKIISDIDDTLQCSGGSWPAGIHTAYPKHAIYPGVLAFYRELDLGISGVDEWDATLLGNLVFLSARPHVYKSLSEDESYKKFRHLKKTRNFYTSPTLLAGGLDSGTRFVIGGDPEPVAEKKFTKFVEYIGLYPEFKYIFIGDNGQGDARTVEMLMDKPGYSEFLARAYIHEVQPVRSTYAKKASTRSSYCSHIYYFRNYIDAAIDAYHRKLIRLSGLQRVMLEAIQDFQAIDWFGGHHGGVVGGHAVVSIHPTDLSANANMAGHTGFKKPSQPPPVTAVPPGKAGLRHLIVSALYREMEMKKEAQMRDLNLFIRKGNKVLAAGGLAAVQLLEFTPKHKLGDIVHTPYGRGIVKRFRPLDGMYELLLYWETSGIGRPIPAVLRSSAVQAVSDPVVPTTRSTSLFRSKSSAASHFIVNLLEIHLKSIAFVPPKQVKKAHVSVFHAKSAREVRPLAEWDLSGILNVSYRDQLAWINQQYSTLDNHIKRLLSQLPKPGDWDAYRQQFHAQVTKTGKICHLLHQFFMQPLTSPVPGKVDAASTSSAERNKTVSVPKVTVAPIPVPAVEPLIAKSEQQIYNIAGSLVWTTMGIGWVAGFRDSDGMVLVVVDVCNASNKRFHTEPRSPLYGCSLLSGLEHFKFTGNRSVGDGGTYNSSHFTACYLNMSSLVLLTDHLLTVPYQQALAEFYVHSKFAACMNRLENAIREREATAMFAHDDRQPRGEVGVSSPSRLTAAALSTMRALGIIKRGDKRSIMFPVPSTMHAGHASSAANPAVVMDVLEAQTDNFSDLGEMIKEDRSLGIVPPFNDVKLAEHIVDYIGPSVLAAPPLAPEATLDAAGSQQGDEFVMVQNINM